MIIADRTFETPEENLAFDEALLDDSEEGADVDVLRFWESPVSFVVVGSSNRVDQEVNVDACGADGVPILRRNSGGGAVVQGPGCLNYSLILRMEGACSTIDGTNRFVLERHAAALGQYTGQRIQRKGFTDLTVDDLKFSGNSQRRRLRFLLFHGTLLLSFDLSRIERYLLPPSREPEYRRGRDHRDFVRNLDIAQEAARSVLQNAWKAHTPHIHLPGERTQRLIEERYGTKEWNFRF